MTNKNPDQKNKKLTRRPAPGVARLDRPSEVTICVRVTTEERAALQTAAERIGASVSDLMRDLFTRIMDGDVVRRGLRTVTVDRPARVDAEAIKELRTTAGLLIRLLGAHQHMEEQADEVRQVLARLRYVANVIEGRA